MPRRKVTLISGLIALSGLGWAWWYIDARIDSYIHYSDNVDLAHIDVPQVINACIADPNSTWQLPHCQRGVAAFGLYANDCRARHARSLFFVEKHYACEWLDENKPEAINTDSIFSGPNGRGARETGHTLHEFVRRHAWCQEEPLSCTEDQTREHPNWCLPEPIECARAQLRSIDWLLENDVDINQIDYGEVTVLDIAVRNEDLLIAQELLNRGANPRIVADPETGFSALDRARSKVEEYRNGDPPEEFFLGESEVARKVVTLLEEHQDLRN